MRPSATQPREGGVQRDEPPRARASCCARHLAVVVQKTPHRSKKRAVCKKVGEKVGERFVTDQRRSNSALEPDASIGVMSVKSRQR